MKFYVAVTDPRWYNFLRKFDLEDVNFWRAWQHGFQSDSCQVLLVAELLFNYFKRFWEQRNPHRLIGFLPRSHNPIFTINSNVSLERDIRRSTFDGDPDIDWGTAILHGCAEQKRSRLTKSGTVL